MRGGKAEMGTNLENIRQKLTKVSTPEYKRQFYEAAAKDIEVLYNQVKSLEAELNMLTYSLQSYYTNIDDETLRQNPETQRFFMNRDLYTIPNMYAFATGKDAGGKHVYKKLTKANNITIAQGSAKKIIYLLDRIQVLATDLLQTIFLIRQEFTQQQFKVIVFSNNKDMLVGEYDAVDVDKYVLPRLDFGRQESLKIRDLFMQDKLDMEEFLKSLVLTTGVSKTASELAEENELFQRIKQHVNRIERKLSKNELYERDIDARIYEQAARMASTGLTKASPGYWRLYFGMFYKGYKLRVENNPMYQIGDFIARQQQNDQLVNYEMKYKNGVIHISMLINALNQLYDAFHNPTPDPATVFQRIFSTAEGNGALLKIEKEANTTAKENIVEYFKDFTIPIKI